MSDKDACGGNILSLPVEHRHHTPPTIKLETERPAVVHHDGQRFAIGHRPPRLGAIAETVAQAMPALHQHRTFYGRQFVGIIDSAAPVLTLETPGMTVGDILTIVCMLRPHAHVLHRAALVTAQVGSTCHEHGIDKPPACRR